MYSHAGTHRNTNTINMTISREFILFLILANGVEKETWNIIKRGKTTITIV